MDPFANGLHCVYDHIQHTFVPSQSDEDAVFGSSGCESAREQRHNISGERKHIVDHSSPHPPDAPDSNDHSANVGLGASPQGHVPRPRNAFMIFRTEFLVRHKVIRDVEHDNRHISRIAGHCWQSLSEEEKRVWQLKADQEKIAHMRKYPKYKFSPTPRSKKPVKRKVKRNDDDELSRCRRVADLLLEGKEGEELANAVKDVDLKAPRTPGKEDESGQLPANFISKVHEEPRTPNGTFDIFHNPLYSSEKIEKQSFGTSSASYRIVTYPSDSNSQQPSSTASSPISPMSNEFFDAYGTMKQPGYYIPPYPLSSRYDPEQSGILPTSSSTYNSYIQSPDNSYSPNFSQPAVYLDSPAGAHHISFDHLNSSQSSMKVDPPYRAQNEFTLRHRPSRSTQNSSFHPYGNLTLTNISTPPPYLSPDVDAKFPGHNLRR